MSRTYSDTPEPRYVEKAKESETTSALPEIKNADRGKFLKVKANKNELMYDNIPSEVPVPTISDAGKVLGVDESGDYALVEGGGGKVQYDCTFVDTHDGYVPRIAEGDFTKFPDVLRNVDEDTYFVTLGYSTATVELPNPMATIVYYDDQGAEQTPPAGTYNLMSITTVFDIPNIIGINIITSGDLEGTILYMKQPSP